MIWIDYLIISIIIFSALLSLIRGFVHEVLSLITWVCLLFIVSHYYIYLAIYFTCFKENIIRNSIAITLLFLATLIVGMLIKHIISLLIEWIGLSSIDHLLGIFFGTLRGIIIMSIVLFLLDTFTIFSQRQEWEQSILLPQLKSIIIWVLTLCNTCQVPFQWSSSSYDINEEMTNVSIGEIFQFYLKN